MEILIIIGIIITIFILPGILWNKETENLKDEENIRKIENKELNVVELNYYQLKELTKIRKMIKLILTIIIIIFTLKILIPLIGVTSLNEIINNL